MLCCLKWKTYLLDAVVIKNKKIKQFPLKMNFKTCLSLFSEHLSVSRVHLVLSSRLFFLRHSLGCQYICLHGEQPFHPVLFCL